MIFLHCSCSLAEINGYANHCPHVQKVYNRVRILGEANEAIASHIFIQRCREGPLLRFSHLFFALFFKWFITPLEPHSISSEASHTLVKIKQKFCANMPKGAPQQFECLDKEQFKIKWLQTIYNAKCTFTQKPIPRQNEKCNLVLAKLHF